jgi:uncharacterized membrane protein
MQFLQLYGIAIIAFFAIDIVWLVLVAQKFYRDELGDLFTDKVIWPAALLFYAIFIVGVVVLVVQPALDEDSFWMAVGGGALLGLVAYSTYDLTNLATTRNWPLRLTIVDIIWGTVLAASVSSITFLVASWLDI